VLQEDLMETADVASVPIFAGLSPSDVSRVAAVSRPVHLAVGNVVVKEGEFAFDFYAITQGGADVQRAGERIATLGPGDFFGEIGVVPDETRRGSRRRGASVIITAPTDAIAIAGTDFRRLAEEIPALGDAVRTAAAQRLEVRH
jgi:CRP/FNR family transcriptional regulator, cyclic AMP receptor protein